VAEGLTGWLRADAIGRPAADILEVRTETGVNLCAPNGALRRTLRLGTSVNTHFAYLFRLRTSDDPVRVAYSVSALRLRGKTPDGALIAIHDVTPELETIEARDALMLAASHELKDPADDPERVERVAPRFRPDGGAAARTPPGPAWTGGPDGAIDRRHPCRSAGSTRAGCRWIFLASISHRS